MIECIPTILLPWTLYCGVGVSPAHPAFSALELLYCRHPVRHPKRLKRRAEKINLDD